MTLQRSDLSGRLLSEFLVSLGLLFLLLVANIAILDSSVQSSFGASTENIALNLARNCMEETVAQPGSQPGRKTFEIEGTSFHRQVRLVPLDGERAGLTAVWVEVEWKLGSRSRRVRLERYVRRD